MRTVDIFSLAPRNGERVAGGQVRGFDLRHLTPALSPASRRRGRSRCSRHEFQAGAVGVLQAVLDEGNGELRHVNADPVATEFLGGVNRRAAAAERIQHHVAGIAAGLDDPLQQRHGLLRRVAETFVRCISNPLNVCPNIANGFSFLLVEKNFSPVEAGVPSFFFRIKSSLTRAFPILREKDPSRDCSCLVPLHSKLRSGLPVIVKSLRRGKVARFRGSGKSSVRIVAREFCVLMIPEYNLRFSRRRKLCHEPARSVLRHVVCICSGPR